MVKIMDKKDIIKVYTKGFSLYPCAVLDNCVSPGRTCIGCTFSHYVNKEEGNYYHTLPLNIEERDALIDRIIDITILKLTLET